MSPGQFGHDVIDNIHRAYHPLIHVHDQHLCRKLTDPMLCHTVSTGTQKVYCTCVSKVHDCVLQYTLYMHIHVHVCTGTGKAASNVYVYTCTCTLGKLV